MSPDFDAAASMARNEARFSIAPTPEVLGRIDETLEAVQPDRTEEIRRPAPWVIGQTRVVGDLVYEYTESGWEPIGPAQPGAAPPLVEAAPEPNDIAARMVEATGAALVNEFGKLLRAANPSLGIQVTDQCLPKMIPMSKWPGLIAPSPKPQGSAPIPAPDDRPW